MVGKYAIVESGRNVSIHTADVIQDGFETVEDAVAFIDGHDVIGSQIVALILRNGSPARRFLTGDEQARFNLTLSEKAA